MFSFLLGTTLEIENKLLNYGDNFYFILFTPTQERDTFMLTYKGEDVAKYYIFIIIYEKCL